MKIYLIAILFFFCATISSAETLEDEISENKQMYLSAHTVTLDGEVTKTEKLPEAIDGRRWTTYDIMQTNGFVCLQVYILHKGDVVLKTHKGEYTAPVPEGVIGSD